MKLWGGRFEAQKSAVMEAFDTSFPVDKRLWEHDIKASMAHVTMLGACAIIPASEADQIVQALSALAEDVRSGALPLEGTFEDIHSFVEYHIVRRIGDVGKKMHTARSRNEQVAVDTKLFVKDSAAQVIAELQRMQGALRRKAEAFAVPMPGYTHMQKAQIITFKYHLMAYDEMFARDVLRLEHAVACMDTCPLGSGALAGSTYDIDRRIASDVLGFSGIQVNTLDAVSDRDYIIEFLSAFSILMMHLSRMCEEWILYCTQEFNFLKLSDAYSTGSSLMPHKKNPDSLELIRGKTGRVYGNLMGVLTVMKGLPLAYNKDMQEDKRYYFESYDTVFECLNVMVDVVDTTQVNVAQMASAVRRGFLNATELADYLVRKNVAFRDAHECVGRAVSYCEAQSCELQDLPLEVLQSFCQCIDSDVYAYLEPERILEQGNKLQMQ